MVRFIIFILYFEIETDIMIILNLQIKKNHSERWSTLFKDILGKTQFLVQSLFHHYSELYRTW